MAKGAQDAYVGKQGVPDNRHMGDIASLLATYRSTFGAFLVHSNTIERRRDSEQTIRPESGCGKR
jgi:hypothetical protein